MSNLQKSKVQYLKNKETESGVCVGGGGGHKGREGVGGGFQAVAFITLN